jgi:hypothetical protein
MPAGLIYVGVDGVSSSSSYLILFSSFFDFDDKYKL